MAVKRRLGKLPLPESVGSYVARRLAADDVRALPVGVDHAAAVETLELLHRDPFDRLLIVQARHEGLRLLTIDDQVLAYGSPTGRQIISFSLLPPVTSHDFVTHPSLFS